MINIIKQEITFDESLKQRLEFICDFCNTKPTIINGYVKNIKRYIEQTNGTTSNLRDANDINIVLKKYEDDL